MKLTTIKLCENLNFKNLDDLSVVGYLHDEILKSLLEEVIKVDLDREEYDTNEEYESEIIEEITQRVGTIVKDLNGQLEDSLYGHKNSKFLKLLKDHIEKTK